MAGRKVELRDARELRSQRQGFLARLLRAYIEALHLRCSLQQEHRGVQCLKVPFNPFEAIQPASLSSFSEDSGFRVGLYSTWASTRWRTVLLYSWDWAQADRPFWEQDEGRIVEAKYRVTMSPKPIQCA